MSSDPWSRVLRSLLSREQRAQAALTETLKEGVAPQQTPYDRGYRQTDQGNSSPDVRGAGRNIDGACGSGMKVQTCLQSRTEAGLESGTRRVIT